MCDLFENKDTIKLLTRNAVKCLACNKVIESKHRHDFVCCGCSNETAVDGGLSYQRVLGKDLNLIENLREYKEYTKSEYEELKRKKKEESDRNIQERIAKGEVIERGGTYYDAKVLKMLFDNNNTSSDLKNYIGDILENVK